MVEEVLQIVASQGFVGGFPPSLVSKPGMTINLFWPWPRYALIVGLRRLRT